MAWFDDTALLRQLASHLAAAIGSTSLQITSARLLSGGAIQQNVRLDVEVTGGPLHGKHVWVLRTDAAASVAISLDRQSEYEVLRAASAAGVKVATPIVRCGLPNPVGAAFFVQSCLAGSAQARRIVRDPDLPGFGHQLAQSLAVELAAIHAIRPASHPIPCLPIPAGPSARIEIARLRKALDGSADPRPALEYILAWLDEHAPPARAIALVHGDFRTGNYMVDAGKLMGLLDWEFAHWGDPDEDIGWLTARCWRFGNDKLELGGIAPLQVFLDAYKQASGRAVFTDSIAYWQILAAARWAAIAVLQGDRYRRGGEQKLELALTGLMVPEMEHDALTAILEWRKKKPGAPQWQ